jgi:hypothetical protein
MDVLKKVDVVFCGSEETYPPFLGAIIPAMNLDFSTSSPSSKIFGMGVE